MLVLRPYRIRILAVIAAVILSVLYVVGWFALPREYTAEVNLAQILTLLAFLVLFVGALAALAACRVRADAAGLSIRNGLRTCTVPWDRVHKFLLRPGDPWASVLLKPETGEFEVDLDAEKRQLMAIQTSDGRRAQDAIAQLRRRHADWLAVSRSRGT
ncbi:MAG: PH domain-containing protein [Propionibacteriaceae bacterium]